MCGLLGLIRPNNLVDEQTATVVYNAGKLMYHRGPEDPGYWHDETIALTFNRLAFIDIDHSHQPLRWGPENSPERYVLVFNGEIYNYLELRLELASLGAQFTTLGDGEAILAAWHYWGVEAFSKFRGMFAFAIWDTETRVAILARDPFGIKPLFYAHTGQGTLFSSEKKCLLELARLCDIDLQINPQIVQQYTQLQYVPEPYTLHEGILRLESGHYAFITPYISSETETSHYANYQIEINRYFYPQFIHRTMPDSKVYQSIADTLVDSVEKHMRSEVTVGAFLSGGIDSTAIAAIARKFNPQLKTFTIGFAREGYSEIDVAAATAHALGTEHISTTIDEADFISAIPEIVWYLDEPVADPSLVPLYYLAKMARKYVKVVLSGEGADELFGGYTIYKEPLSLKHFNHMPNFGRTALRKFAEKLPDTMRGKSFLHRGSMHLEERYFGNARSFNAAQLTQVLNHYDADWGHEGITRPYYAESSDWDPIARMQYIDFYTWLRGDILVKADKMTMANSLELRVPFMDKEVFDIARTLKISDKISHNTTKYALRRALALLVPEHVINRPKLGFPVPIKHWLRQDTMQTWARNIIAESHTEEFYRSAEIIQMLDEHRTGNIDHSRRIWTILVFMIWHQIFVSQTLSPVITQKNYPVRL